MDTIIALLRQREEAIAARDVESALALLDEDVVSFDLPPPLATVGPEARDPASLRAWMDSWIGPISARLERPTVIVDGDLAVVFGFLHMQGERVGSGAIDVWARDTVVLRRRADGWRIVHEHSSFPMEMDGSGRAATDLRP